MRISEIQQQLPPEEQSVPVRRALAWSVLLGVIAAGIALYFRYAARLEPLIGGIGS